jgi:hypothetical protein
MAVSVMLPPLLAAVFGVMLLVMAAGDPFRAACSGDDCGTVACHQRRPATRAAGRP